MEKSLIMESLICNKTLFITGGAGFIGSTLVGKLIDDNKIVVFDNFRRDALSGKPFAKHKNLTVIKGDVLDLPSLRDAMKGANIVVHCAAVAGIDTVVLKPTETMRVNMIGTANVLQAAMDLDDLHRLVDFSTSEVFGQSAFRAEECHDASIGQVGVARWTYAVSKLAAEHLTAAYYQQFEMPTTTVRPFNIYGPGQVGEGAIRTFINRALRIEDLEIHGDGNQIRAWCYVDDFIRALLLAITSENAIGESINLGNARAVITIYGLAQTIVRVLNADSSIRFVRKDYADVELRVPSVEKARELLGFEAEIDLEEGIRRTAEWYKENRS